MLLISLTWVSRLGKTFISSVKSVDLGNDTIIVVCQKSKVEEWCNHYKTYFTQYNTYDLSKPKQRINFDNDNDKKVGVINYDSVFRIEILDHVKDITLLLDESSLIKHYKTKKTKYIMHRLSKKAKGIILCSGSVCGGRYEDLYTQMKLLGWTKTKEYLIENYTNYKTLHLANVTIKEIISYKNVEQFKQELYNIGCRFKKTEEVLTLPTKTFIPCYCKKPKEYKQFHKDKIVEIDGDKLIGDTPLNELLYKRLLCGPYNIYKTRVLQDLLSSTDDRIILFYNFKRELKQIKKVCDILDKPISYVNGEKQDLFAYEELNNSVTCVQYQSGAMGLNLQKAFITIYYSLPLSSELFEQSKKRIHRLGQKQPCTYYLLLCEKSIEQKIYDTLEKRNDYTLELFNKDNGKEV